MEDTTQVKRKWKRDESRLLCAEAHKNSTVWVAAMHTPEYREVQRKTKLGKKNGMYGKTHTPEVREKLRAAALKRSQNNVWMENQKSRKLTDEQKEKHRLAMSTDAIKLLRRESRMKQIKASGGFPSYNPRSCVYFDKLNSMMNWNGQFATSGGEKELLGYSVDYFVPEINLIIEWDEEAHFRDRPTKTKDAIRQSRLIETGVKFYRIREKTKRVTKIDQQIEDLSRNLEECF